MTNMKLRAWKISSKERLWSMAIALICCLLLVAIVVWPTAPTKPTPQAASNPKKSSPIKALVPVKASTPVHKNTTAPIIKTTTQKTPKTTVEKPSPPKKHIKKSPKNISKAYFVQVGAFRDKKLALRLQKKLLRHWPVQITQTRQHLHAVQVGPYQQQKTAKKQLKLLQKKKLHGFITHH